MQKIKRLVKFRNKNLLFLALPQIGMLVLMALMIYWMVSVCTKSTKGPASMAALLQQLQRLQAKFTAGRLVNPQTEREEMEILQNKIKTRTDPALISGNDGLKQLFHSNGNAIKAVLAQPDLHNRTAWIKLNTMMVNFDEFYFRK